jgi:hypothetical protein
VHWNPPEQAPEDAPALERRIAETAPDAQVQANWRNGCWLVRALSPALGCGRGRGFEGRDLSEAVAEVLRDAGYPASS